MAVEAAQVLLAIGSALVVAYLASSLFRRTQVPDILFLLATGAILGPWLGLLDVDGLRNALPLLSALAVITILFDGALEVTPDHLRKFGGPALTLSVTILAVTTLACGLAAHLVAGLPWDVSFLLGLCFGGAGIAIIIPLARRMDVSANAMAVILLEAVTSDIFVIVGMYLACTVLASGALDAALAFDMASGVALALVIGPVAGWLWSRFLARWGEASNSYTATLAMLLLVYAGCESIHASGPLAVLLFGVVIGNAKSADVQGMKGAMRRPVFGTDLIAFHHEIVFFVRAAFFVALGAVARWDLLAQPAFLETGLLLGGIVAVSRALGVTLVLSRNDGLGRWDKVTAAVLFPMGLVTAAVSIVPRSFGLEGADIIADYAAVVIVITNVLATVAVFVAARVRGHRAPPALPAES